MSPVISIPTSSGSHLCGAPCSTASRPARLTFGTPKRLPDCRNHRSTCPSACPAGVEAAPPHVRHAKPLARLQESPIDLPERLSLFGHPRLPSTEVELLNALATHHDLHLWLPHPSDDLWQKLAGKHGPIPR